jgi:PPOX class probable F420-dependent enzyme
MDVTQAQEFLRDNHRAVLATRRRDGSPQMSPVTVTIDGEGRVVLSTRDTAMKTHNLRRHPHASLCVMNDKFYGNWVQVDGTAEIVERPEAIEGLVDYYRRAAGEHPDWDEYRAAMDEQRRVLVRITIERAGPNRAG